METTNNHLVSFAKDIIDKALERFVSETDILSVDPQTISDAWIEAFEQKLREWMPTEEGKTLNLVIEEIHDDYELLEQGIGLNEFDINFDVYNLNDCPEDAVIGRNLFDAEDYIKALKKGIELAQMGYTDIKYTIVEAEERW